MKSALITSMVLIQINIAACSPVVYKEADQGLITGRQGFLDMEIAPGIFVVEVAQIGGYQFMLDKAETLRVLVSHWKRRANELCPAGFAGDYKIVKPLQARIPEFYCDDFRCREYPLVSGAISCVSGANKK